MSSDLKNQFYKQLAALGLDNGLPFWFAVDKNRQQRAKFVGGQCLLAETYKRSGEARTFSDRWVDAFDYLTAKAEAGSEIYYYPVLTGEGIEKGDFIAKSVIVAEIDNCSVEEQWNKIREFEAKSGITFTAIVFSGGKSLHASIRLSEGANAEQSELLSKMLAVCLNSDPAVTNTIRAVRIAGFARKSKGSHITLERVTDNVYSVEGLLGLLEAYWAQTFKFPFSAERYKLWRSEVKTGDSDAFDREIEVEQQQVFVRDHSAYDAVSLLEQYTADAERMSAEMLYRDFNGFAFKFKRSSGMLTGCSPFSATNASGTAFKVNTKNNTWFCHASGLGGHVFQFLAAIASNGASITARGKDYENVMRNYALILGRDYDRDRAEYRAKKQAISVQVTKAEAVELSAPVLTPIVEAQKIDAETVVFALSEIESEHPVLVGRNVPSLLDQIGTVESAIIHFPLNDIRSTFKLAWLVTLHNELLDLGIGKIAVRADGREFTFEKFSNLVYTVQKKDGRRSTAEELETLSREFDVICNVQYLKGNVEYPKPGVVTIVDSAMGTGKTVYMKGWLMESSQAFGLLGYRNGLLRQTVSTLPAEMKIDKVPYSKDVNFALCVDSILSLPSDYWVGRNIVIDEVVAVIKHLCLSPTLKKRGDCILAVKKAIQTAIASGASVLAMEADITNQVIDFFEQVCEVPVYLVKNTFRTHDWHVQVNTGSVSEQLNRVLDALEAGQKVAVATDSKNQAKAIIGLIAKRGLDKKVIAVTGDTSETADIKQFLNAPDQYIAAFQPDLLVYTPSFESGGDISKPYFDVLFGVFTNLATRAQKQLMGRVRSQVKREVFVKEQIENSTDDVKYSVEKTMEQHTDRILGAAEKFHGFKMSEGVIYYGDILSVDEGKRADKFKSFLDRSGEAYSLLQIVASFEVTDNIYRNDAFSHFCRIIGKQHTVYTGSLAKNDTVKEQIEEIKEDLHEQEAKEYFETDVSGMTVEQAEKIKGKHNATKEERLKASKFLMQQSLPGLIFTLEMVKDLFTGESPKIYKIKEHWLMRNPDVAECKDAATFEFVAKQKLLMAHDYKTKADKADLYEKLGVFELMQGEWTEQSLEGFAARAQAYSTQLKVSLGLSAKLKPVKLFNTLLARIGVEVKLCRKEKGNRIYCVDQNQYTLFVFEALDRAHERRTELKQLAFNLETAETRATLENSEASDPIYIKTEIASDASILSSYNALPSEKSKQEHSQEIFAELPEPIQMKAWSLFKKLSVLEPTKSALKVLSLEYSKLERQIAYDLCDEVQRKRICRAMA